MPAKPQTAAVTRLPSRPTTCSGTSEGSLRSAMLSSRPTFGRPQDCAWLNNRPACAHLCRARAGHLRLICPRPNLRSFGPTVTCFGRSLAFSFPRPTLRSCNPNHVAALVEGTSERNLCRSRGCPCEGPPVDNAVRSTSVICAKKRSITPRESGGVGGEILQHFCNKCSPPRRSLDRPPPRTYSKMSRKILTGVFVEYLSTCRLQISEENVKVWPIWTEIGLI